MNTQSSGGRSLNFTAKDGGSITLGHGIYAAGDVIQQNGVSAQQLADILSQIITAHPTLDKEEKNGLIEKIKTGIAGAKDLAQLAIILVQLFNKTS